MTKRWRDEVAARKRGDLLERRKQPASSGAVDTVDRTDESANRRRIAGERRTTAADPAGDAAPDDLAGRTAESDSQSMARDLADKPRVRTRLAAPLWATLTGLIVGGVLTGFVYAGMQIFQAIYNTPAGDGVGAVVLGGVLVIATLVGRFLMKWRGLHDPNATTLLGVMLMLIVTLGVLLPIVFSAWMLLITPLLGATTYLVSHLLVTHFGTQQ